MHLAHSAVQSQNVASALLTSEQILPFGFTELYCSLITEHGATGVLEPRSNKLGRV